MWGNFLKSVSVRAGEGKWGGLTTWTGERAKPNHCPGVRPKLLHSLRILKIRDSNIAAASSPGLSWPTRSEAAWRTDKAIRRSTLLRAPDTYHQTQERRDCESEKLGIQG